MAYRDCEKWIEIRKGGDFAAISERYAVSPVIARILRNRDITSDADIRRFLYGTLRDLDDPALLDAAMEAVRLLHDKVRSGSKIRIIGDYDVDGICATYILFDTLRKDGACIDYEVPDRIRDGFGLNVRLIEDACDAGVDTILTCDNGIAATHAVARAKELGMTVILTDHHEPNFHEDEEGRREYLLPEADIIVDPKKPGCMYPNKDLCGAAVAWKLMHLYECMYMMKGGENVLPVEDCPLTLHHLPYAAIATITDVMKLTGENRILVQKGLAMLPGCTDAGIRALIAQTGISGRPLRCYDIGFILGPCLNAGGRLDSAMRSIALLAQEDPVAAMHMASELAQLNTERKNMTQEGTKQACLQIESGSFLQDRILIVYLPGIHESVAGIIASKIKDNYNRPAIILTDSEDPELIKGSGRSTEAYNMFEGLTAISDLFVKFGGHAMAAGVTLRKDRLAELRHRINDNCTLTDEDLIKKVRIDMRLPFSYVTEDFVESLHILEPFGPGNRGPLFAQSNLKVLQIRVLGEKRNAVRLLLEDNGTRMDALWFGDAGVMEEYLTQKAGAQAMARLKLGADNDLRLAVTYQPQINEFRGVRSVQIHIVNYQ